MPDSELTGGLTYNDRRGTLVDWNLCFSADGTSSRNFRSGTPAFMAPVLLANDPIARRNLAHDMESFFAVIIWIASLDYFDEIAFQAKPLASILLDRKKDPMDIAYAKYVWFEQPEEFQMSIIQHLEPVYYDDIDFIKCLITLRRILYSTSYNEEAYLISLRNKSKEKEREDPDPMKEDLFRKCMEAIDVYLGDTKGSKEIEHINSLASASHS